GTTHDLRDESAFSKGSACRAPTQRLRIGGHWLPLGAYQWVQWATFRPLRKYADDGFWNLDYAGTGCGAGTGWRDAGAGRHDRLPASGGVCPRAAGAQPAPA